MFGSLFAYPLAEARAFYGPAFPAMLKLQRWLDDSERTARAIRPDLIDEVAHQVPPDQARVAWSLRQQP